MPTPKKETPICFRFSMNGSLIHIPCNFFFTDGNFILFTKPEKKEWQTKKRRRKLKKYIYIYTDFKIEMELKQLCNASVTNFIFIFFVWTKNDYRAHETVEKNCTMFSIEIDIFTDFGVTSTHMENWMRQCTK